jgi:hypothetical protein
MGLQSSSKAIRSEAVLGLVDLSVSCLTRVPLAEPKFKNQQIPDSVPLIDPTLHVLIDKGLESLGSENSMATRI